MVVIALNHKVQDFDAWRPHFDADIERRKTAGVNAEHVLRGADDPNNVYIYFEVDDPAGVNQMLDSPELAAKMEEAGVIGQPNVTVLNPA